MPRASPPTLQIRTRCPPCIPHPSHISRAQARGGFRADTPFLPIPWGGGSPQGGETEGRRVSGGVFETSSTASPALTRRPLRPLLRQGYGGPTSPRSGEEREWRFPRIHSGVRRRSGSRLNRGPARRPGEVERGGGKRPPYKESTTQRKPRASQHEARGFLHLPQQVGDASSRYRGKRFDRLLNCRSRWPCRTGCCRWSCGRSRSR